MIFFETRGLERKEFFSSFSMKDMHFPMHFHRAYELIFVEAGEITIAIDHKEYWLKENDLAFIFPNQLHEFKGGTASEMLITQFSPELVEPFYTKYKHMVPQCNIIHLLNWPAKEKISTQFGQLSFLYSLCDDLLNQTKFEVKKTEEQSRVLHRMLSLVEQKFAQECSLLSIAGELQYDYSYLSKLFIQKMHMSFTEYLNQYRISKACYMILNTQRPIGEIAAECGYRNLRTFHRNFKMIAGMSPKAYRLMQD